MSGKSLTDAACKSFQVRVTEMGNWRKELLVVMHELAESFVCLHRGIPEPEIMAFDIAWEAVNTNPEAEPGNDPAAPYHAEHRFAEEVIERPMAEALGVDWADYEMNCVSLCEAMGRVT